MKAKDFDKKFDQGKEDIIDDLIREIDPIKDEDSWEDEDEDNY